MENGGNAKVNGIFEARLAQSGRPKPTHLADGQTRERFIRDKYERRKFYDAAGFFADYSTVAPPPGPGAATTGGGQPRPGAPSDIARQRVANRQALMKPTQSNVFDSQPGAGPPHGKVAPAPVSAPVIFDLLDFGSEPTPAPAAAGPPPVAHDPFASPSAIQAAAVAAAAPARPKVAPPPSTGPGPMTSTSTSTSTSTLMQELMSTPSPAPKAAASNDSIMALFGSSQQAKQQQQQQPVYGMPTMAGMGPGSAGMGGINNKNNMMMTNGMIPQQQTHGSNNMNAFVNPGMTVNPMAGNPMGGTAGYMASNTNNQMMMMQQQQQQQQQMMMQNMMMGGGGNPMGMSPQQMQQQQMMMMMMQQQAANSNQAQMANPGMMKMYNAAGAGMGIGSMPGTMNPSNNANSVVNGMQNMSMGNPVARQSSDDGGFGTPMGGSAPQQSLKNDPFGSLGGMNAFR